MLSFTDEELRKNLSEKYKADASELKFHSFPDIEANVKNQIYKIKSTQFLPKDIPVYGFVYDVRTGKLKQVAEEEEEEIKQKRRISVRTNA